MEAPDKHALNTWLGASQSHMSIARDPTSKRLVRTTQRLKPESL